MFRRFNKVLCLFTYSKQMSTNIISSRDVQFLATYGTLRDDDDSGASWTKEFIKGISQAKTGQVFGYQIVSHSTINYPFAIYTGDRNHSIIVRLLSWPTEKEFKQKIDDADRIEGDEYERKIVEVHVENKIEHAFIYVSANPSLGTDWKVIPSGDWLKRPVNYLKSNR